MDTPNIPAVGSKKISRRNGSLSNLLPKRDPNSILPPSRAALTMDLAKKAYQNSKGAFDVKDPFQFAGKIVGKALVRHGKAINLEARIKAIEFAKDLDFNDYEGMVGKDPFFRSNAYGGRSTIGGAVRAAETSGRIARDLGLVMSRRNEAQNVGNFKVTPESRHTARITHGPAQRERRNKYEWEKVGTQRKLAVLGIAGALYTGAKLNGAISRAARGGGTLAGIANLAAQGGNRVANAGRALVGKEAVPFTAPYGVEEVIKKTAKKYKKKAPIVPMPSPAAASGGRGPGLNILPGDG